MEYEKSQEIKGEQTLFEDPSFMRYTTHLGAPSPDVFILGAAFSIGASLVLRVLGQREDAQFVGQWAPTLLVAGLYTKGESRILKNRGRRERDVASLKPQVM